MIVSQGLEWKLRTMFYPVWMTCILFHVSNYNFQWEQLRPRISLAVRIVSFLEDCCGKYITHSIEKYHEYVAW